MKKIKTDYPNKQVTDSANKAATSRFRCVNHPGRDAFVDVDGILYCKECYLKSRK